MPTRRSFVQQMLAGVTVGHMAVVAGPYYDGAGQARPAPSSSAVVRPSWLEEGIASAEYMEPLEFYIRRGDAPADIKQLWNQDFNDAGAKRYKDMGINLVVMPLHKGMGLKAEAESIDATRRFTQIAHSHGIKVAGYVGSSIVYETFYEEEPDAPNWEQVDERGRPMYYGDQTFRHAACRNNPSYRGFIQKVLRLGILDLKLDMIHFDQLEWWSEPSSCHCKYCQEKFRTYLRLKYTDDQLKDRFGFATLNGIRVPDFNLDAPPVRSPSDLRDPLRQEWTWFRCASLAEWWAETHQYIRKLNPEVALLGNPTMAPSTNCGFTYGIDLQQLLPQCEFLWSEEENWARWTADDRLVSMIRSYKMARSLGKSLFVTQWLNPTSAVRIEGPPRLRLAEAIAYNDCNLGLVAGGWEVGGNQLNLQNQKYLDFFRSHNEDLVNTTPITDVAILRSFASIEFNPAQSNVSTMLFEQTLIQDKFPFGIIFDSHLKDLGKYKVLVLANQDALSDEQNDQIRQFVKAGGGLVATEETSKLNEFRKERNKFGLSDMFGIDTANQEGRSMSQLRRDFGKGRVAYIPRIEPEIEPPAAMMSYYFGNEYWKLPKNYRELSEAVRWAARHQFSVRVEAPMWVTMELAEQKARHTWILHLLNFRNEEPLTNIPVQIRIPDNMRLRDAVLESPDDLPHQILQITGNGQTVSFTVPKLAVYDFVRLRME